MSLSYRRRLKWQLFDDPSRKVAVEGRVYLCEGQAFQQHECRGGPEMNEVFFTRNHIKHLTESKKRYFWDPINCAILCSWFHHQHGHTTAFRQWWRTRVDRLYGHANVQGWLDGAPLKIKHAS